MQLGGVVWSLMGNLDVVVVGVVLGAAAAGRYGAALRLAEVGIQFLIALSVIYLPEATKLAVAGRREALATLYRTTSRWSTIVSLLAAGLGFLASPALAQLIFSHSVQEETDLLRVLFVGYALHGALGQTYSTLLALGAYAEIWRSSVVTLPLMVGGTVALAAGFGTIGAATATCLTYAVTGVWWAILVRRDLGVSPFDAFYIRALAACLIGCGLAAVATQVATGAPPAASVIVTGVSGVLAVAASLRLVGGLSPEELGMVNRRLRGRVPGLGTP